MDKTMAARMERACINNAYLAHRLRKKMFIVAAVPVLCLIALFSVASGCVSLSPGDVFRSLSGTLAGGAGGVSSQVDLIVWQLRLPRIAMGLLAGMALGGSGAVMQVVLRNPLADPYMLGIASAAGFGASLALIFGIGVLGGPYLVIGNAFLFALMASGLIMVLSGGGSATPESMVLTGLALLFFFQALTTIVQYFGDSDAVKAAVFWSVGNLGRSNWGKLAVLFPLVCSGLVLLLLRSRDLNIMNAGDDAAMSLGVPVAFTRAFSMVVCSLLVAGVVSFTGTIGFVGLVAPHMVRLVIGNDVRFLVPASALVGAILLIASDTLARSAFSPVILPVGAVTAFLGVPLLIFLIRNDRKGAT
ncbi:FecCD family ABC transporter permease [Desulfoluna spongiiphila]|uniref:FecCD family ABC transporter permease n=1 Tax=Desulfoluna spongiiphila TaxID=419481 RepID=UPI00125543BB|nr:iron ABC transporter permease [Desulfoluna spongiiphila]VVS94543.1 abc transporter permease protein btuc-like [Desulfoluna spongiiphila]